MRQCLHHLIRSDCPDCIDNDENRNCKGYVPVKTIVLEVERNEEMLGLSKTRQEDERQKSQIKTLP
jgi:hypothetical protein